jgi:lysophospholipase L1-like esterase
MMKAKVLQANAALAAIAGACLLAIGVGCEEEDTLPSNAVTIVHDFGANDPNLYVAFGDSITHDGQPGARPSYPERLSLLLGRTVVNEGVDGERSAGGRDRVDSVLKQYKPGYLLIIYGANDAFHARPTAATIENLQAIIDCAKDNRTIPVLATTLPIVGLREEWANAVVDLNRRIRDLAERENLLLVDLEKIFAADTDSLLRPDGVHPSYAGNDAIAEAFYDVLANLIVVAP